MTHSNGEDFGGEDPAARVQATSGVPERVEQTVQTGEMKAAEGWKQAKGNLNVARERTEFYLRENPVPAVIGALAVGLVIGLAIRYAARPEEKEDQVKNALGHINWSALSLPLFWPIFKSAREKIEDSAEAVKDSALRLKKEAADRWDDVNVDRIVKPLRKRWNAWS